MSTESENVHVGYESTAVSKGRRGKDASQETEDNDRSSVFAERTPNLEAGVDNK